MYKESKEYIFSEIGKRIKSHKIELGFTYYDFPKKLFNKLLLDTLYGEDKLLKTKLNDILIDYVPYAKYHSFWQLFVVAEIEMPRLPKSKHSISSYFYRIRENEIFERYEPIQINAIEFLFCKYDDQISKIIRNFLKDNFCVDDEYSLKKIDIKLAKLVSQLIDFFADKMPNEDSLGLRVWNIIISDYKKFGSLISMKLSDEKFELNELNQKLLVESSLAYITELERVQVIELEVIKEYKFSFK